MLVALCADPHDGILPGAERVCCAREHGFIFGLCIDEAAASGAALGADGEVDGTARRGGEDWDCELFEGGREAEDGFALGLDLEG